MTGNALQRSTRGAHTLADRATTALKARAQEGPAVFKCAQRTGNYLDSRIQPEAINLVANGLAPLRSSPVTKSC